MADKIYGLIDVDVSERCENGSYLVSRLAHEGEDGDADPVPWGDTEEHSDPEVALRSAKNLADYVVGQRHARRAVVFQGGRDVYCVP